MDSLLFVFHIPLNHAIPSEDELSNNITMELSPHGGHVGFVSGSWPWSAEYWLERRLVDFIADYF